MPPVDELAQLIVAQAPLIAVDTIEEERLERLLAGLAAERRLPLLRWTITTGLQGDGAPTGLHRPAELLRHLIGSKAPGILLLLDLHPFLADPVLARSLREAAASGARRTLLLVGHDLKLPPEIDKLAAWAELPMPQRDDYLELLKDEVIRHRRQAPEREPQAEPEMVDLLLGQLVGLTERDARLVIRRILADDGSLTRSDMKEVFSAKHRLLGSDSGLALETSRVRLDDLAGLANLKTWLATRAEVFRGENGASGLDLPKGVLLLGVQGCGKSMAVKAIATAWDLPLLRLDFGTLYNKFLGETERSLRDALRVADAMSPCVLWMDEIEKGLATSNADGGESRRLLGTLLTWMAERRTRVFMVATSNDIEQLPPELVRKGRFDEIFFVDLPTAAIRADILRIHLARRGQDAQAFDLPALAARTEGFSGAELEQAVVGALYAARAADSPLSSDLILAEIARTRPLAVVMAEKIAYLRAWAAERTVSAD